VIVGGLASRRTTAWQRDVTADYKRVGHSDGNYPSINFGGDRNVQYDLQALQAQCRETGFKTNRPSQDLLEVVIRTGLILAFINSTDDPDTMVGFVGTGWHFHGKLTVMLGESRYMELDAFELIDALQSGDIFIIERFMDSELEDRWLMHRLEPLNVKDIEPSEELRVYRVSLSWLPPEQ